jgi:hypothetical protein
LKKFKSLKPIITRPVKSIIFAIILMIIIGIIGTLQLFGPSTAAFTFFGAILFSFILFVGIFGLLYNLFKEVFFVNKVARDRKAKVIKAGKQIMITTFALIISLVALFGSMLIYWSVRLPPSYDVDSILQLETWTAVPGSPLAKNHKSNTDLFYWNSNFYLIYQNSKWHLQDLDGELVIARSSDATAGTWQTVATVKGPGHNDVRDPLITDINGRLFLYFLPNFQFDPEPNTTYYCYSDDGVMWTTPVEIEVNVSYSSGWMKEAGWVFGRQEPITRDNLTWYLMASGMKNETRMTILLSSTDGIDWTEVSVVYDTYGSGEPCLMFLPSGELIATLRVGAMSSWTGYEFGTPHAGTIIATSYNNMLNWSYAPDFQTRLDGARLFPLEGNSRIFAAGRNHLGPRLDLGNHVARKRTSIYEVTSERLIFLFDLPSNGDTAYTGVVVRGDDIYVSYYTCPINKDLPWIVGITMLTETEIRIAKFSATGLIQYADNIIGG